MSAEMNGFWSPTTTTWPMIGFARIGSSSAAGATFLPPAVTMISFLRPVIVEEALVVERTDVAGLEPVAVERRRRRRGVVPVSSKTQIPLHLDLAVVGDAHRHTGKRRTDRADLEVRRKVDVAGPSSR